MAEINAPINIQVKGTSKLDRLIASASQLDSIVKGLNKNPIELNTRTAASNLDKFDAELKALQISIGKSEKSIDGAGNAISEYATQIASLQTKLNQLNPNTQAYNKVLDRQQKAIRGLAQAQSDLSKAQKDLESSQGKLAGAEKNVSTARTAKLAAEALNGLADSYIKIKSSQKGVEAGATKRPLFESSISQINSQADALKLVAANAKIASSEFNRFSIASQAASQELFAARQKQLSAIAFGLSESAPKVNLGQGGANAALATRNQVQDLVKLYPQIVKSEAGLSAYGDELRRIQSLVPYASEEFRKLENVLAELNQEISEIGMRGQRSAITLPQPIKALGPTSPVEGTLKQRQQYAEAVNKQYQKQLDLSDKIDRSAISVADKEAFSLQLNQALDALGENRLEDAQKMTIEINRQVSAMSRLQKTEAGVARKGGTQVFGALGTGFSPIGGELPSTVTSSGQKIRNLIPGSPAARLEEAKASRESTEAAVALAKQKQKAIEQEAEELRRGTQAATALGKQKLKALEEEAARLRSETSAAVALAQQKMREEEKAAAVVAVGRTGGTYRTGEFSPMGGARRLTSTLASGAIVEQSLLNLQGKGVNVADRLVQLQNALNTAKQDTFEVSIKSLDALSDEVALAGKYAQLQRQILAGQGAGGRGGASKESGFRPALTSAEVKAEINKIVTDFNAVAPKVGSAGDNIASTFAAELKQGASSAAAAAKTFAAAALEAIKDVFGIASPSRVMKEIAENLVSSFITELVSNIPSVKAALEQTFSAKGGEYEQPGRARTRGPSLRMEGDPRFFAALSGEPLSVGRPSPAGIFPAATPRVGAPGSAFPFQTYGMSRTQFPSSDVPAALRAPRNRLSDTSAAVSEAIKEYRAAVNNFWEGEDSQFEAITKILTSSARLGAARLARRLQQGPDLTQAERIVEEARTIAAGQRRGTFAKISDVVTGDTRLGVSSAVASTYQRISDALLNSLEALGSTVSDGFKDAIDRVRNAVPSVLGGIAGILPPGGFGGGRGGGGAAGAGGGAPQSVDALQRALGLGDLAPIARATGEQIDELTARLSELRKRIDPTTQDFAELTKQLGVLGREQERRAPDAGFLTRRFGPRGGRAVSEGLVGGAFPLLFGQGVGAAALGGLGGAAGGFAGGGLGFGLSLVGTALGTAFDAAVQSATELGAALNDTTQTFDKVKERALFSSKETEKLGDSLQELGFVASAAILSQQEVVSKIGTSGANSLARLGDASDKLNRAWAELNLQLQAALAGPMAGLLEWVSDIVGIANQRGRSQAAARDLIPQDEADKKRFEQELTSAFNQTYGTDFGGNGTPRGSIEETIKFLSMDEKGRAALAELSKKFPPIELDVTIKKSQEIEEQIAVLSKRLEIVDIGKSLKDQFRSAAREQQDLDKQRADLVRSYEESIGNIRRQIEDEIRNKRFATLEKENQLLDLQGQIRLKQLQIVNQADIAGAGVGLRPEAEQAAKEVAQLVATYSEQQLSAEEEAAKIKRDAALEVQKIDFEAANFKAQIEKEVSRLNVETARRVADINEQVKRRNEEFDSNRFKLEKAIAELQLKNSEIIAKQQLDTAQKNLKAAQDAGDAQGAAYAQSFVDIYKSQLDIIEKGQKDIGRISAPSSLRGVGQVGGGGVSFAGLNQATAGFRKATEDYVAAQLKLNELDVVKNADEFRQGIIDLANKTDAALTAIQTRESDAEIERLRYIELVNAGLTDTVAQKVLELEAAKRVTSAIYDAAIAQLESKIIAGDVTDQVNAQNEAYRQQIEILRQRKDAQEGKFGTFDATTGKGTGAIGGAVESESGKKLQDFIARTQAELNDLEAVAVRVSEGIGNAIANSLANGVAGLIEGTTTAKEVFANFLRDVGQILVQEGTKMIGMYFAIGIAKIFAGLSSGGNMGGKNYFDPMTGKGVAGPNFGLAKGGAFDESGNQRFAKGGTFTNSIVSSPTLFKFADGGAMRTGVMGEAGPEAIMPLKRNSSGRLGVEASGLREAMGSAPGNANSSPVLNMSFESTNIGGVEYVSRDQLEQAMAATRRQAANDGAKRGMSMTLDRLQQSPQTRRRVGI